MMMTHLGQPQCWAIITWGFMVVAFLLIIYAGLYRTPVAERNLATVLTWNIWWAGLVISVFFLGSSWCAVCPWDTLANCYSGNESIVLFITVALITLTFTHLITPLSFFAVGTFNYSG